MAIDLCDLQWGAVRVNQSPSIWRTEDWVLMTEFSVPEPSRYVRLMAVVGRKTG